MPDIFLSYAREDRPWATRLAAALIERGWSLFWDPHIPVGRTFDQVIESQIDVAGCIVVLWSRHSVSSNWVKAEASEGARRGILHPVLIENVRLPLEFRRLQTANLIDWPGGASQGEFDRLVGGIAATLRSSRRLSERLEEARAALGRRDYARCLELLRESADAAEASGLGAEVAELRRTAEVEQDEARREELGRQRAQAEERRAAMSTRRSQAQAADAATRASALWLAAEAKMGAVAAAFDDEAYLLTAAYCEEAIALYGQSEDAAQEAARREELERRRHAADEAHERMAQALESAQSARARERAPTLWIDAERRATEAQAALAEDDPDRAVEAFQEAAAWYRRAEEAAREDVRREEMQRAAVSQARDAARAGRNAAALLQAAQRAPDHWESGESTFGEAEAALAGDDYRQAKRLFDDAARSYESAGRGARDVRQRERQEADASRARMAAEREASQVAVATPGDGPLWSAAEAAVAAAEAAYDREQYGGATQGYEKAAELFRAALDQLRARRDEAERVRAAMVRRREVAQAGAPPGARAAWVDAEARAADGESAFQGGDYAGAAAVFEQAAELYRRAHEVAPEGLLQEERGRPPDLRTEAIALDREAEIGARAAVRASEEPRPLEASQHSVVLKPDLENDEAARREAGARASEGQGRCLEECSEGGEALSPDLAERPLDAAGGGELPAERPTPRPALRWGRIRFAAAVGLVAVGLSAVWIHAYWTAPGETPRRSTEPSDPAGQPPGAVSPPSNSPPQPLDSNRGPEVGEDLREKAVAAREQAAKARAERFADALFATAAGHLDEAEAALAGGRIAEAQAAYRRALDGFAIAATEAQKVLARKRDETGRLQMQADDVRRTAAAARAESLAGPQWSKATGVYRAAQAAVAEGDHAKAGELLQQAIADFGDAAKTAARLAKLNEDVPRAPPVRESETRPPAVDEDAARARSRMADAKRAAEKVAANFHAHQRFTWAQSKERDGIAALRRSDPATAVRLFGEAQSEYQAAAQEAKLADERERQLIPERHRLEHARAAALERRQQALAAEADRLARDVFDQAEARHMQADGLAKQADPASAAGAYQDAADRYGDAMLRARAARAAN